MPTRIAITGAAGRMGQRLVALSHEDDRFTLSAALERSDHPRLGEDAGAIAGVGPVGVPLTAKLDAKADVLVDFTLAPALEGWCELCRSSGIALVTGTTGLDASHYEALDGLSQEVPVLQAPNMSVGVNVMLKLVRQIAQTLGEDYDIELTEAHHRFKKDAPSGTAEALLEALLDATGRNSNDLRHGRQGDGERAQAEIGVHSLRIGDEIGRHTVAYGALGERIELTHVATNRDTFVRGALRAARWIADQKPGRYGMADVLGL